MGGGGGLSNSSCCRGPLAHEMKPPGTCWVVQSFPPDERRPPSRVNCQQTAIKMAHGGIKKKKIFRDLFPTIKTISIRLEWFICQSYSERIPMGNDPTMSFDCTSASAFACLSYPVFFLCSPFI